MTDITQRRFGINSLACTSTECCTNDCEYTVGPFVISNNKWGNSGATQCIYKCQENNNFGWEWTGQGNWNYPVAITGNNRGAWPSSTTPYLPIKYSNLNSLVAELSWTYPKQPTGGFWNLAYDIYWWDSNYSQRKYNIMIWIQATSRPGNSTYMGDVSDGFNTYEYYQGDRGWPWDCFYLKNQNVNQTYHKVDIKALMNAITRTLDGNWYVPDLQIGNENEDGAGRIEVNFIKYEINGNNICIEGECGTTTPTDSITVTSPNGTENWVQNTSHNITWNKSGTTGANVKIELYKTGSPNSTIINSTANSGSYAWTVPSAQTVGSDYQIKITDTTYTSINDASDNYFTISAPTTTNSITVTSPNGGENWVQNTSHNITWTTSGTINNVTISLWNGSTWVISPAENISNTGSYSWTISSSITTGSNYKIKIEDASNSNIYDFSNGTFTISAPTTAGSITVTSPNGTENWVQNTSHNITWNKSGTTGANVKIELYKTGSPNSTIINSTANSGSYAWTVPSAQTVGTDYQIKITDTTYTSISDMSNSNFTISAPTTTGSITVTSPNGGENWKRGTYRIIKWTKSGTTGANVKIELYKTGSPNSTIINSTPNDGYHSWKVPSAQTTGTDYQIKITDLTYTSISDMSNGNFTVSVGIFGSPEAISISEIQQNNTALVVIAGIAIVAGLYLIYKKKRTGKKK